MARKGESLVMTHHAERVRKTWQGWADHPHHVECVWGG
jgi:hypothetical protein